MSLAESQISFSRGKYKLALENISNILSKFEDTHKLPIYALQAKLIRSDIYRQQERIDLCLSELDEILDDCVDTVFEVIKSEVYIRKCSLYYYLGDRITSFENLDLANSIWENVPNKDDILSAPMIEGRLRRYFGRYFEFYGNYEKARECYEKSVSIFRDFLDFVDLTLSLHALAIFYIDLGDLTRGGQLLEESLNYADELGNPYILMRTENQIGNLHHIKGDFDKSLECYDRSLEFAKENKLVIAQSYIYNYMGLVHQHKGDNDRSLEYHHKSMEISKEYNLTNNLVICYNNIGTIYLHIGELDKAWENFMISLQLGQGVVSEPNIAGTHNNIGIIYTLKGELDMAFQHHLIHLQTSEKFQLKTDMATAYVNIGQLKQIQGHYEQAKDYFQKCLKIDYEIGNAIDIAETIYNIIILEAERGNLEEATTYLEELDKLDPSSKYRLVQIRKKIAQAIVNKHSDRIVQKAKAQEALAEISKLDVIDNELSLFAKFNLCELLFNELRLTGNEMVLDEIKELLEDLLKTAQDQNSAKSLSEIYLLQSKLALIEADMPKAYHLLHDAEEIARSKGLTSLSKRISNQFDLLLNQQEQYAETNLKKISLKERIDRAGMEELLVNLINKKSDEEDLDPEKPAFFLILSTGGVTIYQKNFESQMLLKNELVGGLLTAIHNLSSDVFSAQSSTQRIRHNQFTVIIQPEDQLLFTYVFTGSSYNAMGKVEQLIHMVKDSPLIWESLNRDFPHLSSAEIGGLDLIVTDILLGTDIKPTQE